MCGVEEEPAGLLLFGSCVDGLRRLKAEAPVDDDDDEFVECGGVFWLEDVDVELLWCGAGARKSIPSGRCGADVSEETSDVGALFDEPVRENGEEKVSVWLVLFVEGCVGCAGAGGGGDGSVEEVNGNGVSRSAANKRSSSRRTPSSAIRPGVIPNVGVGGTLVWNGAGD